MTGTSGGRIELIPHDIRYFDLNPIYYPSAWRELLELQDILRFGALPLGYRQDRCFIRRKLRTVFNIGILSSGPCAHGGVESLLERLRDAKWPGEIAQARAVRLFRIEPEPFLQVLRTTYDVSGEMILGLDRAHVSSEIVRGLKQEGWTTGNLARVA